VTLLLVLLAVSLGLNVYLARRVLSSPPPPGAPSSLAKGDSVPPLEAHALDGKPVTLSYGGKATVLYVFTPSCPWCRRNLPNVKQLFAARQAQFRFVGLALDDTKLAEYVAQHQLPFPVYKGISGETMKRYRLGGVPQTIVIGEQGRILASWSGAYSGETEADVEGFFGVPLPGLAAPASDAAPAASAGTRVAPIG
jgi:peroxiredoxin